MSNRLRLLAAATVLALTATVSACGGGDDPTSDAEAMASTTAAASAPLVQQGLDKLASGDTEGAKATFENIVAVDFGNLFGNYNLGVIAQQAGDNQGADPFYDVALTANDAFAPALTTRRSSPSPPTSMPRSRSTGARSTPIRRWPQRSCGLNGDMKSLSTGQTP